MTDSIDPGARIGRVSLAVSDLDAVLPFYRDVVGLRVGERTADRAVLGTTDADLLVLEHDPDAPARPSDAAGLFHTAFLFPSRAALGDALARADDAGARLTGASDHRVSEALYLRDPEGNNVELYRDRPREEWPETDGRVQLDTLPLDVDAIRSARSGEADTAGDPAPPDTTVGHVHLEVTDLDDAESFYVDALGLDVRHRLGSQALFVAAGGYHHHVGLNTWNGRSSPASGRGLREFEVVVPNGEALASVRQRLDAAGVDVRAGDGELSAHDADGIEIRVVVD